MSETQFKYNSEFTNNKISVKLEDINGFGNINSPFLHIPFNAFLYHKNDKVNIAGIKILSSNAKLSINNIRYSSENKLIDYEVNSPRDYLFYHEFQLDRFKISDIEKYRTNDLRFLVEFSFQYCELSLIANNSSNRIKDILRAYVNLNFSIPQSQWVNNILPQLGYDSIRIIEMPSHSQIIPEEYSISIKELDSAKKYFLIGDYDKTVAHCRSAIDPIKRNLENIKQILTSNSEYDWIKKISESTYVWLETLTKQTSSLASKTHHPPSTGHFNRTDAEIIFMVCTSIVAFAGNIKNEKE